MLGNLERDEHEFAVAVTDLGHLGEHLLGVMAHALPNLDEEIGDARGILAGDPSQQRPGEKAMAGLPVLGGGLGSVVAASTTREGSESSRWRSFRCPGRRAGHESAATRVGDQQHVVGAHVGEGIDESAHFQRLGGPRVEIAAVVEVEVGVLRDEETGAAVRGELDDLAVPGEVDDQHIFFAQLLFVLA